MAYLDTAMGKGRDTDGSVQIELNVVMVVQLSAWPAHAVDHGGAAQLVYVIS